MPLLLAEAGGRLRRAEPVQHPVDVGGYALEAPPEV